MSIVKDLSRRRFLVSATLAGTAPFILPSRIWAAPVQPGDRLGLGFIGMGKQNSGLLSGFLRKAGTQVIAVCDVDTNRREHARKTVDQFYTSKSGSVSKSCAAHPDFRELLARPDIDAVVIATPDHWHAFIAAANAGKDIYCEKPLCETIHQSEAMVKAVRRAKRVFQTGSMQRSSKEFRAACELVRNGAIGRINRVEVGVGGPAVPCDLPAEAAEPGLNWDFWLGPAPVRPYNSVLSPRGVHDHFPDWRKYREYGGGGVTDWGAHHFDIAQWGLGMDASGPVEVIPASEPNAQSGVRLLYATGVEVVHTSGNGVWFHGGEGRVYVNRGKFELHRGAEQLAKEPGQADAMLTRFLPPNAVRLYKSDDHKQDWLDCVRSRQIPICDVEIGARTVNVCQLVNLAYYHGRRMKWNPQRRQFEHGAGDKSWLDVPQRDSWKVA